MLKALEARGRSLGAAAVARMRRRLVARVGELGGVSAEERDEGVVLSGSGLWRRAFEDARLRWIGGWLR